MGKQEDIFVEGEGDAWFSRNFFKMEDQIVDDPVCELIRHHLPGINGDVLEFGCANGWRLELLREEGRLREGFGVDPSNGAISNGAARFPKLSLHRGTVTAHPFATGKMHLVIYGFCLYVSDPEDLCEIVAQGNNVLADQGYLIIHDFDPEYPHSVPNKHVPGLMTYKMDYSKLWLANPAYTLIAKKVIPDGTAVWLLKKSQEDAFPCLSGS